MPAGCGGKPTVHEIRDIEPMTVTSPAFGNGAPIPERYTCEGDNLSPPLSWSGVPAGTAGLAVVVDDPDAPRGTFVHWIVLGIAPGTTGLEEGKLPAGATLVQSSSEDIGYTGMCPPAGDAPHHYRFEVFALPTALRLDARTDPVKAVDRISASATASGRLEGTYRR